MGERLVESQTGPGHPYPGQTAEGFRKACQGHCLPLWPEDGAEALAAPVGWVLGLSTITHPGQSRLPCKLSDTHLSGSGNPSGSLRGVHSGQHPKQPPSEGHGP